MVADVRSIPYSRYVPHFSKKTIQTELLKANIKYIFLGKELGGKPQQKGFYNDSSRIQYDRIAKAPLFQQGIQRLNPILNQYRTAILCSEENPTTCHRQILIGNHFCNQGFHVFHIRGSGRFEIQEKGDEKKLPNQLDLND
jgi:uncharacterized protein (DUF488 family)